MIPLTFVIYYITFYRISDSISSLRINLFPEKTERIEWIANTTLEVKSTTEKYIEPRLRRRPEVEHIDCGRLVNGDKDYMKEISKNRTKLVKTNINMNCSAIQERILPARNPNTNFPILYARIVHVDYEFLEDLLATDYAEENVYCYAIDAKADIEFRSRMKQLAECIPNVFIPRNEEKIDRNGHNMNRAHLDCIKLLLNEKWKYAILLQNHDVMIKTHEEITEILTIYGGANDVRTAPITKNRRVNGLERNLGRLRLCPKSLKGVELRKCEKASIEWSTGAVEVTLSREAVDYMINDIDIEPLMKQLNAKPFGVDEQLYPSLLITEEIGIPGGFTNKCRMQKSQFISRVNTWRWEKGGCKSGYNRHYNCIYGIEYLPFIAEQKVLSVNKIMPDFDVATASCVSEMLWNRTRGIIDHPIDKDYYSNINLVRYHRERKLANFSLQSFECDNTKP